MSINSFSSVDRSDKQVLGADKDFFPGWANMPKPPKENSP